MVYWVGNTGERAIRKVSLDKVYFGLPYYNVEGELVYSNRNAAEISADVLNIAEYEMRNKFKDNPQLTSYELAQYWLERMKHHMNEISTNRGRVDKYGSTNNPVPVVHRAYAPC